MDPKRDRWRLWTLRLYEEYDDTLWRYRVKMQRPLITVDVMKGRWGVWDPIQRGITINADLIAQHPWDVVIEVLKHEMAHQMVSEVFGRSELHGEIFRWACATLGVADWAASASGELPSTISSPTSCSAEDDASRLLRRVEKLLALATSANENEALAAMERVRALYARYHLEQASTRDDSGLVTLVIRTRKQRLDRVAGKIFSILGEHFFVRVIYVNLYEAADLRSYRAVELLGTRANVAMAEYVHGFLSQQVDALWQEHRRTTRADGRLRRSYQYGLLEGYRKKLQSTEALVEKPAAELGFSAEACRALVQRADARLGDFEARRHPRLESGGGWTGMIDRSAYELGCRDGEKIRISRPLTGASSARGRMLGPGSTV